MKNNNRMKLFDIARGIAILLVLSGHDLAKGIIKNTIYSFHVPIFIIISGYFYKEKSLLEEIKDSFLKLVVPSTLIIILFKYLKVLLTLLLPNINFYYNYQGMTFLWFIYMLVVVKIIFNINKKIAKKNEFLLAGLIFLESFFGFFLGKNGYWLPWGIDVSFLSLIFYYFGYISKKYNYLNKILNNNYLIFLSLLIWIIGIKFSCIDLSIRLYTNGLWSIITAICGSIIIFKLSSNIEKKLKKTPKFLSWCGKYSLYFLIAHFIEVIIFNYNFDISNNILKTLIIFCIKYTFAILFVYTVTSLKKYYYTKKKSK